MDNSLEELKRQRALIQQHLEWLDQTIAERSKPTPETSSVAPEAATPSAVPSAKSTEAPTEAKPNIGDAMLPKEPQVHLDVKTVQIGCLAFFILSVAGFLFFLFGLPYLMD